MHGHVSAKKLRDMVQRNINAIKQTFVSVQFKLPKLIVVKRMVGGKSRL
jgi:hypothetical protein